MAKTLDQRENREELASRQRSLFKIITRARKKAEKKPKSNRKNWPRRMMRISGASTGLLTAYRHQVPRGANQVELVNYYDPEGKTITIPLDPALR